MNKELASKIIEAFENVLARPLMYFGKYDTDVVIAFTHGFYMSLNITNQSSPSLDAKIFAAKNRGWKFNALGIIPHMKEKKLTSEEMVKELILLEIETWKLFRNTLEN